MIDFLAWIDINSGSLEFSTKPESLKNLETDEVVLQLWGDPIGYEVLADLETLSAKDILEKVSGHFYYILHERKNNAFSIGNSVFGLLPLYYSQEGQRVFFSNDPVTIATQLTNTTISKRFILENVLFNYPLFDTSCFEEVKLLAVNSCVEVRSTKVEMKSLLHIEDLFERKPEAWVKSLDRIANSFLKEVKKYFPNEAYSVSLTGGFDGRTLAASSIYHKQRINTYCFGKSGSKDVSISNALASVAKLQHQHIALESNYIEQYSFSLGKSFIKNSAGTASFSRAHYLYSAEQLKHQTKYIVTGNFGSEIFRAAHISGVLVSPNLYSLFKAESYELAIKGLSECKEWGVLNRNEFQKEWLLLCGDLKKLICFDANYNRFTRNQQFSILLYNEVIRKYFGAELMNQYRSVINRTPFLDLNFLKELFKTELSGIHSDFFTNNPFKRFKGQVTYAHIISKAFPQFNEVITDKGYKPGQLLSLSGKLKVGLTFLAKKIKAANKGSDDHGVDEAFDLNRFEFEKEIKEHSCFNTVIIKSGLQRKYHNRDSFFVALSQLWWLQYLETKCRKA